jgi:uncharacterized membrane protein
MTLFAFLFIADSERLQHKEMCHEDALAAGAIATLLASPARATPIDAVTIEAILGAAIGAILAVRR